VTVAADDKTEKATPRRRKEARREGRMPRSPDIGAWLSLLVIAMLLPHTMRNATNLFRRLMTESTAGFQDPTAATARRVLSDGLGGLAGVLAPLAIGGVLVAIVAAAAQGGLNIAPKRLKPDFKHLNPVKGLKRLFGVQTLWEAAKSVLKTAVCGLVLWLAVRRMLPHLALSGGLPLSAILGSTSAAIVTMIRLAAVAGVAIGLADYVVARRRTEKSIRMTKHEVKQEHKQSEGDPHIRSAIRSRQIRMSRNRMMADIATADVVLVNPTHVAVALKYEPMRGAPRVVAKGAGAVAAKIRERATEHRVPMVEDVPLARALHKSCEIGQEVPAELFQAVARVLALVMSLKRRGSAAGLHRPPALSPR
jgi:flagellar biosynthetic protein FlhB